MHRQHPVGNSFIVMAGDRGTVPAAMWLEIAASRLPECTDCASVNVPRVWAEQLAVEPTIELTRPSGPVGSLPPTAAFRA